MSRASRPAAGSSPAVARGLVPAIVLSIVAVIVATGSLALVLARSGGSGDDACRARAWDAIPDAAVLPDGWTIVASGYYADGYGASLVGPTPADDSTAAPSAYLRLSCYGGAGHDAMVRSRAADIAAGGTEVDLADLGDESFAISDATGGTTSAYVRRGDLVAYLSGGDGLVAADLELVAIAVDEAIATSGTSRPSARPTGTPAASGPPAASGSGEPTGTPGASGSPGAGATDAPVHVAPDLEALLPKTVSGTTLSIQSTTAADSVNDDPASVALVASLTGLGKTPGDLVLAEAYDPEGLLDLDLIAFRVAGVDAATLRGVILESWMAAGASAVTTSTLTLAGREVTRVDYGDGGPDDYLYAHDGVVFDVWTSDEAIATAVLALLP